ncbi:MAG: 3-oxoacyl-ACP reductase FabG [Cellvibrionaceae bacterium]|nr:3-oxoacyl-ACP reductase FabG [Cellvibrionaceae bacterium]
MSKKRILVTGASGGIGRAIAITLAQQGYAISVHFNRRQAAAEETLSLIKQHGAEASLLQFDLSKRQQSRAVLEADMEQHGAFYGVVCNAGITRDNAFPALTEEDWDQVMRTNLDGFYHVLQPVIMPMIRLRQGGRIVTLSSVAALVGNRGQVNYSAAKAGLIGATKSLAVELGKRKITVNCVAPGVINTAMAEGVFADEMKKMIPLGYFGEPQDVADTVSFLISDSARYITRQVISVNGGMC